MFDRILSKVFAKNNKAEVLAKYQINMGAFVPKWERLKDLNINRQIWASEQEIHIDIWRFTFETHEFALVMNASKLHIDPNPVGILRFIEAYGRKIEDAELRPIGERHWHRQIDAMLEMMPELNEVFS